MRWAQRQRMAFIGECIISGATIRRSDLVERFGVSVPQASIDIRCFNKIHPGAMRYDTTRKAYVPHNLMIRDGRDTAAAADRLMRADDAELATIVRHDPSMIRDVAAALIHARSQ